MYTAVHRMRVSVNYQNKMKLNIENMQEMSSMFN